VPEMEWLLRCARPAANAIDVQYERARCSNDTIQVRWRAVREPLESR
jgi:hypothetical protein